MPYGDYEQRRITPGQGPQRPFNAPRPPTPPLTPPAGGAPPPQWKPKFGGMPAQAQGPLQNQSYAAKAGLPAAPPPPMNTTQMSMNNTSGQMNNTQGGPPGGGGVGSGIPEGGGGTPTLPFPGGGGGTPELPFPGGGGGGTGGGPPVAPAPPLSGPAPYGTPEWQAQQDFKRKQHEYQMAYNRTYHHMARPGDAELLAAGAPTQTPTQPVVPTPDQPVVRPEDKGTINDPNRGFAGHQDAAWAALSKIDPNNLWAWEQGQGQGGQRTGRAEYDALMQYLPPRIKEQIGRQGGSLGGALNQYLTFLRGLGYGGGGYGG